MGIFAIIDGIVTGAVERCDINLHELQATSEGQSAWHIYDMACKAASRATGLSEGEVMGPKGEKAVRQALRTYKSLTLGGWEPVKGKEGIVCRKYANRQLAETAANILALCGMHVGNEGLTVTMHNIERDGWEQQEANVIDATFSRE